MSKQLVTHTATRQRTYGCFTFKGEWQCILHCHSTVSVPHRYDRGRVAVRRVRSRASGSAEGTIEAEWQCDSHCHSTVSVPSSTFRAEWQCERDDRGRVAVRLSLPLDGERTEQYVQGRVAVRFIPPSPIRHRARPRQGPGISPIAVSGHSLVRSTLAHPTRPSVRLPRPPPRVPPRRPSQAPAIPGRCACSHDRSQAGRRQTPPLPPRGRA